MLKNRLAKILDETETTQADLARGIGMRPNTVNEWVRNERQPSPKGLEAICTFFAITPGEVMYMENGLQMEKGSKR